MPGTIEFEVNAVLADGGVEVTGMIGLDIRPTFMLDAEWLRGLREYKGQVTVQPQADLTVTANVVDGEYRYPLEQLRINFTPIQAWPIVITPSVVGALVVTVKVEAGFEPVVELAFEMTAGAHYVHGEGWSRIWDFHHVADVGLPDDLESRAAAEVGVDVSLSTKVYALAGPFIALGPYFGLSAFTLDPPRGPCRWD